MADFTPVSAAIGGALIGLALVFLAFFLVLPLVVIILFVH